ncbi:ATP-dependent helicase [Tepidibacter thalassicus]|uniref:DNA 3'-5' helicase n=1 Tax=Tepidibacter thalassicus DSM 15285 TaxID=1123350 RepID=A0A1M5RGD6_9FIRM|nr:ATP-dependent helicase [Tepidibacter thalassicus]SHH25210.1 DNA helicase-2 / ATP-dependent DNA helicase PcrA [Tepidibacter thalassicus DSM 15285]
MRLNYNNLSENQKAAVNHFKGPCMVLAGPGSGKTRVISYRIINLIENLNVNPENILAISFTRASSIEMRDKSVKLSSIEGINKVSFGTFHSVFFKILRSFRGYKLENILDEKEKKYIIKNILKSMNIENGEEEEIINGVINEISFLKNELMNIYDFESSIISKDEFLKVYIMYENYKDDMKKIDFDDMLINTYNLLRENENILNIIRRRYKYILIDEFQDINKVQFEVLKLISKPFENIFVVGDEDQSIYGFRGARPDFLLEFEKYFSSVKIIVLDINYRSTINIIKKSCKLISNNKKRYIKNIKGVKGYGEDIVIINPDDSEEEAKKIGNLILENISKFNLQYSDFAVIYRTNIQSRALIDVFMDMNIPFMIRDTVVSIYDHWVVKDIISYLKVSIDNTLKEEFFRIINKPFRYISKESIKMAMTDGNFLDNIKMKCGLKPWQINTIEELESDLNYIKTMSAKDAISYIRTSCEYDRYLIEYCEKRKIKITGLFEVLSEIEGSASNFSNICDYLTHIENVKEEISKQKSENCKDRVTFTTIHSAKGLEFKNVFIVGAIEGVIPHDKSLEKDEYVEEERRLFYVAMTRAMDKLYILSPKNKYGKKACISRFVEEINEPIKKELYSSIY